MRIVPSKTKELWTLPENSQIVCGSDLITERNIKNPSKITVKSYVLDIPVHKGLKPLYDDTLRIFNETKEITGQLHPYLKFQKQKYDVVSMPRKRIHKANILMV